MCIFERNQKSDIEMNQEAIDCISGLSYYDNFLTKDEEKYLLEYLSNIEYSNNVKYYGYNYKYNKHKSDVNDFIINIPKTLNIVLNKLDINYNQLVIDKIPVDKQYSFNTHSEIFANNIIGINIGGDFVAEFSNKLTDVKKSILIKSKSLIVISDSCRKYWTYTVNNNKIHTFNDRKIKRKDRYLLTFKNIKFIDVDDSGGNDNYYFTY